MTFAADSVSATPFRGGSATLNPPLGHSKARERKSFFISKKHLIHRYRVPPFSLRLGHARVLTALGLSFIPLAPLRYPQEKAPYPLFLLPSPPQKKKLSKRKRRKKISRSAERDEDSSSSTTPPFEKGGRKLLCGAQKLQIRAKIALYHRKSSPAKESFFLILHIRIPRAHRP